MNIRYLTTYLLYTEMKKEVASWEGLIEFYQINKGILKNY